VKGDDKRMRIGTVELMEGPARPSQRGAFWLTLRGPRTFKATGFDLNPGAGTLTEWVAPDGTIAGRMTPTTSFDLWMEVPDVVGATMLTLEGPRPIAYDRSMIGPSERWRALLQLARPDRSPLALGVERPRSARGDARHAPPVRAAASFAPWEHKAKRLAELATALDGRPTGAARARLRALAELHLCSDLRRFPDDNLATASPYLAGVLPPPSAAASVPQIRRALFGWLASGDPTALGRAWAPWRKKIADTRLAFDGQGITLARLSRRVESVLLHKGKPSLAPRLRALEALLLLLRYGG
jgi:hypothetical protein